MPISCGLHFGWTSPAIPKLLSGEMPYEVSQTQIAKIVMISQFGYLIGCPVAAFLLDKIGRKKSILLLAFPQIIAWLLIANSNKVDTLYIARFTSGISEGGSITTVPIYICEVSEPKVRGTLGSGYAMGMIFGSLLINCYASYMPLTTSAYCSIFVPVLLLVTFVWMPESPYFFIIKNRKDDALRSLKRLNNNTIKEDDLLKLITSIQNNASVCQKLKDLFSTRTYLKVLGILIGLRTIQQFSGGASITFYNQLIFQEAEGSIPYTVSAIIHHACLVIVCLMATSVVDKFGRKPLLYISLCGCGICLFIEGLYFYFKNHNYNLSNYKWVPVTVMILYTVARAMGLIQIPTLLSSELFSTNIRAVAMAVMNIYLAITIGMSALTFNWLFIAFGMHMVFFVFSLCCVFGVVFVAIYIPETKNKTLEEIQQCL